MKHKAPHMRVKRALRKVLGSKTSKSPRPEYVAHWQNKVVSNTKTFLRNKEAITNGNVPCRYTRIAAYVPGNNVLEVGSGEGVLSLLIGATKQQVYGLEINEHRHSTAKELQHAWSQIGRNTGNVEFIRDDCFAREDLLGHVDTVVAARVIYHFQDKIHRFFEIQPPNVKHVVLVGNKGKAASWAKNPTPDNHSLGEYLRYVNVEGMTSLLRQHGFSIAAIDQLTDPIVVGVRR